MTLQFFLRSTTKAAVAAFLILGSFSLAQSGTSKPASSTAAQTKFPSSLNAFGKGFPKAGNPCRNLGESAATSNFLDDSATLVGCPTKASTRALVSKLKGKVVGKVGNITLVRVPKKRTKAVASDVPDGKVEGTKFNATTTVPCSGYLKFAAGECAAGVIRNNEQGLTVVEITWPQNMRRILYFDKNGKISGADTSQADGSAAHKVIGKRESDNTIVTIGPERYVIPDVLVLGD